MPEMFLIRPAEQLGTELRTIDDIRLRLAGEWEWFDASDVEVILARLDALEARAARLVELLRQGRNVAASVPASARNADAAISFLQASDRETR